MTWTWLKKPGYVPSGYRTLGYYRRRESDRAVLFEYHGWELWIPKKVLIWHNGHFHAPLWAIESSKRFQQNRGQSTMDTLPPDAHNDNALSWNQRAQIGHAKNVNAGWWTAIKPVFAVAEGDDLHGIRNIGELLMLCVSEVAEAAEGVEGNLMDDKLPHRRMVEVELADTKIRVFDLAGAQSCDLDGARYDLLAIGWLPNAIDLDLEVCLLRLVGTLSAAMEGHRKSAPHKVITHRPAFDVALAATLMWIDAIAEAFDLDVEAALTEKEFFNAHRPDHKLANRKAAGGKAY